jgi:hypothetical protein
MRALDARSPACLDSDGTPAPPVGLEQSQGGRTTALIRGLGHPPWRSGASTLAIDLRMLATTPTGTHPCAPPDRRGHLADSFLWGATGRADQQGAARRLADER